MPQAQGVAHFVHDHFLEDLADERVGPLGLQLGVRLLLFVVLVRLVFLLVILLDVGFVLVVAVLFGLLSIIVVVVVRLLLLAVLVVLVVLLVRLVLLRLVLLVRLVVVVILVGAGKQNLIRRHPEGHLVLHPRADLAGMSQRAERG